MPLQVMASYISSLIFSFYDICTVIRTRFDKWNMFRVWANIMYKIMNKMKFRERFATINIALYHAVFVHTIFVPSEGKWSVNIR